MTGPDVPCAARKPRARVLAGISNLNGSANLSKVLAETGEGLMEIACSLR
jgi:hypothetical protein